MSGRRLRPAGVIGLVILSLAVIPAIATAQPAGIHLVIESPAGSVRVANGQTVEISGWAADASAEAGTGIEAIEISLDSQNGLPSPPLFANYGISRPDVAQAFDRPAWGPTGFSFRWTPQDLPDGEQTIRVWAHSTQGISRFETITIAIASPPPVAQQPAGSVPTPAPQGLPGLRIENQLCAVDLTLIAPSTFSNRPCPTPPPPGSTPRPTVRPSWP